MSVIHAPKKPDLDLRMMLFPVVIGVLLLGLFVRLWYFQVVKAPELVDRADTFNSQKIPTPAPRGLIYDRKGVLLAGVKSEIVVTAIPGTVKKNLWVLDKIAAMLGTDSIRLKDKMIKDGWRPFIPIPIYTGRRSRLRLGSRSRETTFPGSGWTPSRCGTTRTPTTSPIC
jgi:penicillin-binding protein 2